MRADVNLSVREKGSTEFGTRTEMKNLNSFKAIARAIEGERSRQIDLIEAGKPVIQETRRWDDTKEYSYPMRSKEDAKDYDGHSLAGFVYKRNHVVKQLDGDRAVLTYGGDIVCAAKVSDLILVKKG
jgi:hypothetical protein